MEKGYYHGLYILLQVNKEDVVYRREYHTYMEADLYKEDMEDTILNDEREYYWRICFDDNYGAINEEE